jgi:hypothetical protein
MLFPSMLLGSPMGIANVGRTFKVGQRHNLPQIAIHRFQSVFNYGWSESVGWDGNDQNCAFDTSTVDPTTALYPQAPITESFLYEWWPMLDALLQSGVGTRHTTTANEVIRYFSMVSRCLELLNFPLVLNFLTTSFDWRVVAPYTSVVPPSVWGLTQLLDANDVGVADTWKPLYNRLATKVMMPTMAATIMENSMPYVSDPLGHTVHVNGPHEVTALLSGWDLQDYYNAVVGYLDYLEDNLSNAHNVLASFLPFRVGNIITMFKGYDVIFEEVDYNSGNSDFSPWGEENTNTVPTNEWIITTGTKSENGDSIIFFHKGGVPTVKAVMMTPVFDVTDDTLDYFTLITAWRRDYIALLDDDLNIVTYDGTDSVSDVAQRYRRVVTDRFQKNDGSTDLEEGVGTVGFMPAILAREEIIRTCKSYGKYLFDYDAVKRVMSVAGGSSVRSISKVVAEAWSSR